MKYPITILGEIHFSFRFIIELIKRNIVPETIIIKESNYEKFDCNVFGIEDEWTKMYKKYYLLWKQTLKEICHINRIRLILTKDIQSVTSSNKYLITAGLSTILRKEVIEQYEFPLNVHPSILPYFKGPQPEAQMIVNNENYFGVTIHFLTEQIDSGDIYFQRPLNSGIMNVYELEIEEAKIASIGIKNIIKNRISLKTDKRLGSYYSYLKEEELSLKNKKTSELKNLLRLLPEEFPYLSNGKEIIYPIEISDKKTGMKIETGTDSIYLKKWVEKTSAHNIVYKSLGSK